MIPLVGDKVRVNPRFITSYEFLAALLPFGMETICTQLRKIDWGGIMIVYRVIVDYINDAVLVELLENNHHIWLSNDGRYRGFKPYESQITDAILDPFFTQIDLEIPVLLSPIELKRANTKINANFCAACGGKLKDLGMGLSYKHCPKCEP